MEQEEDCGSRPPSSSSTSRSSAGIFITERCSRFEEDEGEVMMYGPSIEEIRRLREIDEQLIAMGVDEARLFTPPPPPPPPSAPRDTLRRFRMEREDRKHEVDVDRRLAAAREAPLVVLDDDETYDDHVLRLLPPPCTSDVAALVARLAESKPPPTPQERTRVARLTASMRDVIQVATFARETRRRARRRNDEKTAIVRDDEEETRRNCRFSSLPMRPPLLLLPSEQQGSLRGSLSEVSNALLEASLKTTMAVEKADAARRALLASLLSHSSTE